MEVFLGADGRPATAADTTMPAGAVPDIALGLSGVSQTYGYTTVLEGLTLDVVRGEGLAIVGENGAGKSTLMKIMTGVVQPTTGSVFVGNNRERLTSVHQARQKGVVLIPQELAYVPADTIANNIGLGAWPTRYGVISKRQARTNARRVMALLGGPANVRRRMSELTLGEQQLVEIGKALTIEGIQVLCLDEPTAALNTHEALILLDVLSRLKEAGTAIIYVSHRLDELRMIADRVLVLRNGQNVGLLEMRDANTARLASLMLGRQGDHGRHTANGPSATETEGVREESGRVPEVTLRDWHFAGQPRLRGASLSAHAGEVLGVYGLAGSGLETLARGLGGLLPKRAGRGEIDLWGTRRPMFHTPAAARRAGVVYLPADRKRDGLMLSRPVRDNLTLSVLSHLSSWGVIRRRLERRRAVALIKGYNVKTAGERQQAWRVSGGNQQRILFANRLSARPRVLVLHEPTRGVDIGARADIHNRVREAKTQRMCVILLTTDIEEVVDVSDRIALMREGVVVKVLSGAERTDALVLRWAAEDGEAV